MGTRVRQTEANMPGRESRITGFILIDRPKGVNSVTLYWVSLGSLPHPSAPTRRVITGLVVYPKASIRPTLLGEIGIAAGHAGRTSEPLVKDFATQI